MYCVLLKEKLRHIKTFRKQLGAKNNSNWRVPNWKALGAEYQGETWTEKIWKENKEIID